MKIFIIALLFISICFYGLGFVFNYKAVKTEDCEEKIKANQFSAIGTILFFVFIIVLIIYLLCKYL
ncbi:hypothetical protein MKC55_24375 [[Clostridium] innocuum]|nr:hypothetical protein [[Clostridium] innocuum]